MYQTIQISSCVLVQGEFVAALSNGQIVIRDGATEYRGLPIVASMSRTRAGSADLASDRTLRAN